MSAIAPPTSRNGSTRSPGIAPVPRRAQRNRRDLLLHVIDAADPAHESQVAAVDRVLEGLGLAERPRLKVWNKADRVSGEEIPALLRRHGGVAISALAREGMDVLLEKSENLLFTEVHCSLNGPVTPARA